MLRCLEVEFLSLSTSCVAVSSICAAPFSYMCSTQAANNSWKLRLRCGCQFPWCAVALKVVIYRFQAICSSEERYRSVNRFVSFTYSKNRVYIWILYFSEVKNLYGKEEYLCLTNGMDKFIASVMVEVSLWTAESTEFLECTSDQPDANTVLRNIVALSVITMGCRKCGHWLKLI
jgi:hypothetical protein